MFRSANLIKRDPRNGLKMIYGNHPIEVSLLDEDLWLYNASSLTLRLGRENRANPVAGTDRMTRARSHAAQQQAGPSYAAPQEEDEVNSMHMETPHHSRTSSAARTPRPRGRGRCQPPSKMETLISDMENINIGQQTTLQLMQENLDMAQSLQAESEYRWDQWFGYQPPQ
jgi:hypothetical protein